MGFGSGIQKKLIDVFAMELKDSSWNTTAEKLLDFTEKITDQTLSKNLSYSILDYIAKENYKEVISLVRREYMQRNLVISVALREYPELFNRRIYIPLRGTVEDMVLAILASLRTLDNEDAYILLGNEKYTFLGDKRMSSISMLDVRGYSTLTLFYGMDSWTFDIVPIGLTYVREDEENLPYIVEDAVGLGIMGMRKYRLFDQLEDSKDLALDTKNPIMDDEEYDFYNAETDELNDNSIEDMKTMRKAYLGEAYE